MTRRTAFVSFTSSGRAEPDAGVRVTSQPGNAAFGINGPIAAAENVKSVTVDLPAGVVGDAQAVAQCTQPELRNGQCPAGSRVGTFAVIGGIFGGLMSTPIINPPQSAVLGLHRIEDRAVVRNGEIVIRPMMYLALSYDHRLIDGREAVTALKTIKEAIEDPTRLLIDL